MSIVKQDKVVDNNLPLRAVPVSLFPTMHSLQSVLDMAISQIPVLTPNDLVSIIMTYHNTMLQVIDNESISINKDEFDIYDRRIVKDRRVKPELSSNKG